MKCLKTLTLAVALAAALAPQAMAHTPFPPFTNSVLKADLAEPQGMDAWREAVSQAGDSSLVYIDWHLANFMRSGFFRGLVPAPAAGSAPTEEDVCQALRDRTLLKANMGGRPDGSDNHLLANMVLDLDHLPPFTLFNCEAVIGTGAEGLRIRGFFYVPDHRIETANEYSFVPLDVEPSRLPPGFFH
jgi:hypothetical protein